MCGNSTGKTLSSFELRIRAAASDSFRLRLLYPVEKFPSHNSVGEWVRPVAALYLTVRHLEDVCVLTN
jgi:hypothetical protein